MLIRPTLFAASLLFATPGLAQDDPPTSAGGDSVTIGGGAIYTTDYEGSDDYRWTGLPAAIGSVGGFNFQLIGNRASVDLIPDGGGVGWDFQAGPIGVVNFNRTSTKSIDDTRIRALGKIDTGIELGGYVGIGRVGVITSDYDRLSVSLSYRHDINNAHDSGIWSPSVSYMTPLSRKALVTVFASAERVENGYADTYFSVTPAGTVTSGLPTYDADGGWKSWTVGVAGAVSLTGDLTHGLKLVSGVTYKRLTNDFADSPIVSIAGDRDQWVAGAGLAFTF